MKEFRDLRLVAQQLVSPAFDHPEDVVAWMGAMQGQDYNMVKWAVGMRLKGGGSLSQVQQAFDQGKILRTHVMRPTWHIVPAEDIRWMCALSRSAIQTVIKDKKRMAALALSEGLFLKACKIFERHLAGTSGLTKEELEAIFVAEGVTCVLGTMYRLLMFAETIGLICSGIDKNGKPTYALLDERVPCTKELSRDASIVLLTDRYFRSHSPATFDDFIWWSGLGTREARAGIEEIKAHLDTHLIDGKIYYIHVDSFVSPSMVTPAVHLLPAYDEYIIAYKGRGEVLHPAGLMHYAKNGIFYPLIVDQGHAVGLWRHDKKKKSSPMSITYFEPDLELNEVNVQEAIKQYRSFLDT